ncbi:sulfoxide reductase heme-binding subunit YedZ [Methylobacillus sp. MM3]|jgi:sulfoxide reductase heme-binding subunit YedZ|uniref:sulfite oxidase heme-binding subunit YedZ n=1 Tax=Methylobacillus sp. MM3 TaxID=1848039 RepID=UPI0007DE72FA|nr:sulfoxide reductase heme-binding subunit YedZ [Methylobacillus sp. MM3]
MQRNNLIINAKIAFFVIALLPLARLVWLGLTDGLGANPVEFVIRSLGTWTLVCLLVTLSVTPIRLIFGINWLVQLRRMMGLFTFFYVCLHLLAYAGLDQWFDWQAIVHDIAKHPYVLVGFSAFVLMIPLAVTSNQAMIRRLRQRWKMLHRLVYLIAILGVTHYWWLVKKDVSEPFIYAVVLFILLAVRVYYKRPRLLGTFWRPDKAATGA